MITATTIEAARHALRRLNPDGRKTVGFTPTMGSLHQGHLSLVRASRKENDISVASVFVNPTQFGPEEDFDSYPREPDEDAKLLQREGADMLFLPRPEEIYPPRFHTSIRVKKITENLCGASRPGHFDGVATVVAKLFNILCPTRAYFGLKDAQQVRVVESIVRDLNMGVEIRPMPIVRESDGLALSSRNRYLTEDQRQRALCLSESLFAAEKMIEGGERDAAAVVARMKEIIAPDEALEIDYISTVGWESLDELRELSGKVLVAAAVFLGSTRLIDNVIVDAGEPPASDKE
jgi:pantoate--beta-alanine ligase